VADWRIDADTLTLTEKGRPRPNGYTWAEFSAIERPACPTCGEPIYVTPIGVETPGSDETLYVPGHVRCVHGCYRR
jgi:hypothetical protein